MKKNYATKKYKPTKGATFNQRQAQALGEAIEAIGNATPQAIVDYARNAKSPIHEMFEWDDTAAANRYRLFQARNFVNHLDVIVITDDGEKTTKAFHSVVVSYEGESSRSYCSLETVVESEDLTEQVIRKAIAELSYWKQRYAEYRRYPELAGVFRAIDSAKKKRKAKIVV